MIDVNSTNNDRKEPRNIWSYIWYPTKKFNTGSQILFYISIPLSMLFPGLMNAVQKSDIWSHIATIYVIIIVIFRITIAIRYNNSSEK